MKGGLSIELFRGTRRKWVNDTVPHAESSQALALIGCKSSWHACIVIV